MSRSKARTLDICADCGAQDPSWASINRGILICEECCSIHRSLGRHVSLVKSLRKGVWSPSQLQMVRDLYSSGANSVWEHTLLDPGGGGGGGGLSATLTNAMKAGKRKPSPKDTLHPNKADFIRAKHQALAFINRSSAEEESDSDISEQLHSSVRTPNLKTSLRLLAAGADPNYIHLDKGNTPLHMAANAGQLSQIELLLVYGADSRRADVKGKTPLDYAKGGNNADVAERLTACPYELTDRLSFYVCGRKPDHQHGQHFLVPALADCVDDLSKEAKVRIQSLPNRLFEELAKDVYDEIDRRETDEVWLSLQSQSTLDRQTVPFLPVNPLFSSTRNQGRQKLGRYNARELATLAIDILGEAKRRQLGLPYNDLVVPKSRQMLNKPLSRLKVKNGSDNDSEPLYDSVASDNDESDDFTLSATAKLPEKLRINRDPEVNQKRKEGMKKPASITVGEYNVVQGQLMRSDNLIQELVQSNKDMRHEITRLQVMVQKLIDENGQLRAVVIPRSSAASISPTEEPSKSPPPAILPRVPFKQAMVAGRPQSMYERPTPSFPNKAPPPPPRDDSGIGSLPGSSQSSCEYSNQVIISRENSNLKGASSPDIGAKSPLSFPSKEEVFRKTEQITKRIQELLVLAQDGKREMYICCSDKIRLAVEEMIQIFPEQQHSVRSGQTDEQVFSSLNHLKNSALRLQSQCQTGSSRGPHTGSPASPQHETLNRHLTQQVIQSAYDIAKAAKQLVTMFQ